MYNSKYSVTWIIKNTNQDDFSSLQKEIFEASAEDFNEYFKNATDNMTKNKKYISKISYLHNKIIIMFETEKRLSDYNRRGNALRQYSRFLAENRMDIYVYEHRLMRAA